MIRFILILTLFLSIASTSYGQSKEDSLGVYTDVKSYFKVSELRDETAHKDSIILSQSKQITSYDQTLDSCKFIANNVIQDKKNLEINATKKINSLNRQIKPLKKVLVIETSIIILRIGVWFLFKV